VALGSSSSLTMTDAFPGPYLSVCYHDCLSLCNQYSGLGDVAVPGLGGSALAPFVSDLTTTSS
jgi:hypothetical protein